jgi:hypothetical protein
MSQIQVFHNPNFLQYDGNHAGITINEIVPTAIVNLPSLLPADKALSFAFQATQHTAYSWWEHPHVTVPLRSTSVGDVLINASGEKYVVENLGFQPFQSRQPFLSPLVEGAFQLLAQALQHTTGLERATIQQAQNVLLALHTPYLANMDSRRFS